MPRIHPQLPYEVLQSEVLPRLPAKSIGRFRCVCKAWNSFLSTPDFARMHLRYQTNHKLLLLDLLSPTFRTLDREPLNHDSITTTRPIPFKKHDVLIIASLDGLVCVCLEKTRELAFWNPLTGAYKKIRTPFFNDISCGALAFYNDSLNDYKLLHVVSEGAFIYSRRLDSWRKINAPLERYNVSNFVWSMTTFVGDKVYFKVHSRSTRGLWCLMCFDVECEKFKEIQFPPIPCGAHLRVNLAALNGCIHLCVACGETFKDLECDMWRMDGDGWIKVAEIAIPHWKPFREIYTKKNGNWLAICKDGKGIKNLGFEDFATDFYAYFVGHSTHLYHQEVYIETLVSPNP
ncbi:putative F-box domain, galactose oxidase/kelch, beta-propeller, F-box associated interaction [Helianthus anomalus]